MKNALYQIGEMIFLSFFDNKIFIKDKKRPPSFLSYNVVWFTNCNWIEQLEAFGQIDRLYSFK